MMAALDAIKARYRIGQYYLAGQSGGGTVTAAMLNMRTDIECAVISSGNVAVWQAYNSCTADRLRVRPDTRT
jgi:hypothetical protein